jgi:site-specific DNA recombinase
MLRDPVYIGNAHWGDMAKGKYHTARGDDIIPTKKNGNGRIHRKPHEDTITVERALLGIVDPKQFARVQGKLKFEQKTSPRATRHNEYPLTGLIFCKHCGNKMIGATGYGHDRHGKLAYRYPRYVCSRYAMFARGSLANPSCGHQQVAADLVQKWLVQTLQSLCLGVDRGKLVQAVKNHVQRQNEAPSVPTGRLEKRAADLDKEIGRLVRAIRTIDAAELTEELALVQAERDRIRAELVQAAKRATPVDVEVEAEAIADSLMQLGERLADSDPAIVREVFHRLVSKIECRWQQRETGKRTRWDLVEGRVKLRPQALLSVYGVVEHTKKLMT